MLGQTEPLDFINAFGPKEQFCLLKAPFSVLWFPKKGNQKINQKMYSTVFTARDTFLTLQKQNVHLIPK